MKDFTTKFDKVDLKDDAQWAIVEDLAARMPVPHKPDRRLDTIIVSNADTGERLGYLQTLPWPVVVTSWVRPGGDTIRAIKQTTESLREKFGGAGVTACPLDSKFYPHMQRLGFTPSNLALFYTSDTDDHGQH